MRLLYATLHTLGISLEDRIDRLRKDGETGAATIEIVFWTVGLLVLAGIVYAFLTGWINGKLAGIT